MRFVLLTALLLAVPAGCLVVAGRQAASLEDALFQDASGQVKQFDDLVRMYPPSLRRMKNSAEYLRLQRVGEPAEMAAIVCRAPEGPYSQILDRLPGRCAEWQRLRRARARGMLGAAGAVLTLILLLLVRIGLRWRPADDQAAQATRLVMVGIQALLAVEAAGALLGPRGLVQSAVPKASYVWSILAVAWLLLFWIERRAAMGFLRLAGVRIHRRRPETRRRRRIATPHV